TAGGIRTSASARAISATARLPTVNWQLATSGLESKTNIEGAIPELRDLSLLAQPGKQLAAHLAALYTQYPENIQSSRPVISPWDILGDDYFLASYNPQERVSLFV